MERGAGSHEQGAKNLRGETQVTEKEQEKRGLCRNFQLQTSEIITIGDLCSQGIELLCGRLWPVPSGRQLPFTNRVHDFNTGDGTAGRPKRFES
jgi:hypothetical protein